ncbi:uncharacterized protein LOC134225061 [Armigeres subalbatus]|uniref:uncharacterized protein LOC134225061 n=1 Tax=Armigeres subalbatus TaxID=124917 RepID=UPI002ED44442
MQPFCSTITSRLVAPTTHQIFKTIEALDNKFESFGFPHPYAKDRKIVAAYTLASIAGCIALTSASAVYQNVDMEYSIETNFFALQYAMTGVYSTCAAYFVLDRFFVLLNTIRTQFPLSELSEDDVITTIKLWIKCKKQLILLKHVKLTMDRLNLTVNHLNQCFAIQMFFCVAASFVIGIVCSFNFSRAIIYRNDQLIATGISFTWFLFYLAFVLIFIAIASRISTEIQRTGIFVHKAIYFCTTSRAIINEPFTNFALHSSFQSLLQLKPVVSSGFFVYDWSLLYTMLGTTATYLIILIQFDVSFIRAIDQQYRL